MSDMLSTKVIKKLRKGGPRTFRSMAEFRAHFFPEQYRKEQEREKVSTILDEAKSDYERQLSHKQAEANHAQD